LRLCHSTRPGRCRGGRLSGETWRCTKSSCTCA